MEAKTTSAPMPTTTPNTLITIKVAVDGTNRRFKLPLRDLNAELFPVKIRALLQVQPHQKLLLERFSDSSTSYIELDPQIPTTYKQLYRAAKAKHKLRFKATIVDESAPITTTAARVVPSQASPGYTYMSSGDSRVEHIEYADVAENNPFGKFNPTSLQKQYPPMSLNRDMTLNLKEAPVTQHSGSWQVFCNNCDKPMADAHFHCGICDKGDYDLCESCVESGKLCHDENHWLIKRYIKNGTVVNSTTERAITKSVKADEKQSEMPGTLKSEPKPTPFVADSVRTCNGCVRVLPKRLLVTCQNCEDFDLCISCHLEQKNGHHPAHAFIPAEDGPHISEDVHYLCAAGRNVKHTAYCDLCDERIYGIRHKCLDCPDWDLCNTCFKDAATAHRGHRFVPVYEALGVTQSNRSLHHGVYCDGPLCKDKPNQSYIKGTRYKCAICSDTDFCANCEAHPSNEHNATHPLIKFKTLIRNVTVNTIGEDGMGSALPTMGDRVPCVTADPKNNSTETLPPYTAEPEMKNKDLSKPVDTEMKQKDPSKKTAPLVTHDLDAAFVRDMVQDGTSLPPDFGFQQVWTLRNMGRRPWPIGCRVRHIGGDNMLNIRRSRVASISELTHAMESEPTEEIIEPGREIDFPVWMRTPAKPGHYISYWRLQGPDGCAFGHKLWCDIEVKVDSIPPANATAGIRLPPPPPKLPVPTTNNMCYPLPPPPPPPAAQVSRVWPNHPMYGRGFSACNPPAPLYMPTNQMPGVSRPNRVGEPTHQNYPLLLNEQHQRQLHWLLQARRKRESHFEAGQSNNSTNTTTQASASTSEPTSTEYHNKRRASSTSSEQTNNLHMSSKNASQPTACGATSDYHAQLRMLEEQNKRRLLADREEHSLNPRRGRCTPVPFGIPRSFGYFPQADAQTGEAAGLPPLPGYAPMSEVKPHQQMMPPVYPMTPADRKAAHAAAAAAACSATNSKLRAMNQVSGENSHESNSSTASPNEDFDVATKCLANPSVDSKKVPDIRDYLVEKKHVNNLEEEVPETEESERSTMVFPKIEKDGSPASSIQLDSKSLSQGPEATSVKPDTTSQSSQVELATETETNISTEAQEDDEAFETLSVLDVQFYPATEDESEGDEAGFLTDEDYDILDASDEEFIANHGKSGI